LEIYFRTPTLSHVFCKIRCSVKLSKLLAWWHANILLLYIVHVQFCYFIQLYLVHLIWIVFKVWSFLCLIIYINTIILLYCLDEVFLYFIIWFNTIFLLLAYQNYVYCTCSIWLLCTTLFRNVFKVLSFYV
jgi:hypothetical protein